VIWASGCAERDSEAAPDCGTTSSTLDPECVVPGQELSETTTTTQAGPTVEHWEGTLSGSFLFPNCGPGTVSGTLIMDVAEDGSLSGALDGSFSSFTCEGGVVQSEGPADLNIIAGKKTPDAFEIEFGADTTALLAIDGTTATGPLIYNGANGEFVVLGNTGQVQTIELRCTSC
jgi:hypothetical protein